MSQGPPVVAIVNTNPDLRTATGFKGQQLVLMSVNVRHAEEVVGDDESVYEIVGEEHDISEVVRAVKEASRARPTR